MQSQGCFCCAGLRRARVGCRQQWQTASCRVHPVGLSACAHLNLCVLMLVVLCVFMLRLRRVLLIGLVDCWLRGCQRPLQHSCRSLNGSIRDHVPSVPFTSVHAHCLSKAKWGLWWLWGGCGWGAMHFSAVQGLDPPCSRLQCATQRHCHSSAFPCLSLSVGWLAVGLLC